jgi:uncharacterized protein DUF4054
MPTYAQFIAQFPEFANISASVVNNWLGLAVPFFNQPRWDDMLTLGVLYWVAHQIQSAMANASQPLTDDTDMQKAGDLSYSRDSKLMNAEADNPYLTTAYGRQYWKYARLVGTGGIAL